MLIMFHPTEGILPYLGNQIPVWLLIWSVHMAYKTRKFTGSTHLCLRITYIKCNKSWHVHIYIIIIFIMRRDVVYPRQKHTSFIRDLISASGLACWTRKFHSYTVAYHVSWFPVHEIIPKFRHLCQSRLSNAGGVIYQATAFQLL